MEKKKERYGNDHLKRKKKQKMLHKRNDEPYGELSHKKCMAVALDWRKRSH